MAGFFQNFFLPLRQALQAVFQPSQLLLGQFLFGLAAGQIGRAHV